MRELLIFVILCFVCANAQMDGPTDQPSYEDNREPWERPYDEICLHHDSSDNPCGAGMECHVTKDSQGKNIASCRCRRYCKSMPDPYGRFQVCSNQNETFTTLCDLERHTCMCKRNEAKCEGQRASAVLAHFGRCKYIPPCHENHKDAFPERVRRWIANAMIFHARRGHLDNYGVSIARKAVVSPTPWVLPALWKFCIMDKDKNGRLSEDEYRFFRADLIRVENCLDDHFGGQSLSYSDWAKGFGVEGRDLTACDRLGDSEGGSGGRGRGK